MSRGSASVLMNRVAAASACHLRRLRADLYVAALSVRRQCALLSLARSGVYRPVPTEDEADLALMRRIDELFLAHPFLGSRRMAKMLSRDGARVNRKRVQRLMRLMGIEALGSATLKADPLSNNHAKARPTLRRSSHPRAGRVRKAAGGGQESARLLAPILAQPCQRTAERTDSGCADPTLTQGNAAPKSQS